MIAALLVACADEPLALTATPTPTGVTVVATEPVDRIELRSGDTVLARRALPAPSTTAELSAPLPPGTYRVVGGGG
ncbi:MAG: hypothetical protein ACOZNI_24055, partial [Myxococcota bacterium]